MNKLVLVFALSVATSTWMVSPSAFSAGAISINPEKVTVAGVSSGAQMAHQLHLAYPEIFNGAALLAGGPFGCAGGALATAMSSCMSKVDGQLTVDQFVEEIRTAAENGQLGNLKQLADDRVWVFHGALDTVMAAGQSEALVNLYEAFTDKNRIRYISDVAATHTFPTLTNGNACDVVASPFIGACNYDAAGELLRFLYGDLQEPVQNFSTELIEVVLPGALQAGLLENAYLFVPTACKNDGAACKAQMVIHGCNQSSSQIGTQFMTESGYLGWAEANNIVLAFPQVAVAAVNPYACWDWWGYSGDHYRWRDGKQMKVLADWMLSLE